MIFQLTLTLININFLNITFIFILTYFFVVTGHWLLILWDFFSYKVKYLLFWFSIQLQTFMFRFYQKQRKSTNLWVSTRWYWLLRHKDRILETAEATVCKEKGKRQEIRGEKKEKTKCCKVCINTVGRYRPR